MTDEISDKLSAAQIRLLRKVAAFNDAFQPPPSTAGTAEVGFTELPRELDDFFELIYKGSNLELSGAADYHDWHSSERGQQLIGNDPAALDDASFSDVMFAWVVLARAGKWAWEDEDYLDSINAGVFAALTERAGVLAG